MTFDFAGKTVLITGGTRGIGSAMAKAFSNANARVICTGTNSDNISNLKDSSQTDQVSYIQLDLSDDNSIRRFFEKMDKENPKIDVLINNAGINQIETVDQFDVEAWNKIIKVNLSGSFAMINHFSKGMIERKSGKILNIASIFGSITKEKRSAYTSSKAGLIGLTKTSSVDLAPHGILVNSVSPGFINTELTRTILSPKGIQELVSMVPMNRLGEVHEVANLALFICSDLNTFITGQNITIDGGFVNI